MSSTALSSITDAPGRRTSTTTRPVVGFTDADQSPSNP